MVAPDPTSNCQTNCLRKLELDCPAVAGESSATWRLSHRDLAGRVLMNALPKVTFFKLLAILTYILQCILLIIVFVHKYVLLLKAANTLLA